MAQLDDIVGDVMKKLKDMGVDDNTIVVFTTDNGTEVFTWPDGGQTPFAQGKGTVMEGGFRAPAIIRWPGKVPAGKVENGIISGLDWFPTFVAAAGNPNIVDELKKGKELGGTTYKVHLDGYNQMDMITGKGPSSRHEIFYFGESTLGAVRIDDFKYRFIDQPGGWLGDKTHADVPYLTNLRLDPFERTGWPENGTKDRVAELLQLVQVRVLALRLRPAGSGEARRDGHRVPADAEGRELQPRCREGEDRGRPGGHEPGEMSAPRSRVPFGRRRSHPSDRPARSRAPLIPLASTTSIGDTRPSLDRMRPNHLQLSQPWVGAVLLAARGGVGLGARQRPGQRRYDLRRRAACAGCHAEETAA